MLHIFSQTKKQSDSIQKVTLKIDGMHCVSCSINIDGELEDTPGVVSAKTSYAAATSEIEFDPSKVSVETMKKIIESLGYTSTQ